MASADGCRRNVTLFTKPEKLTDGYRLLERWNAAKSTIRVKKQNEYCLVLRILGLVEPLLRD